MHTYLQTLYKLNTKLAGRGDGALYCSYINESELRLYTDRSQNNWDINEIHNSARVRMRITAPV